MKISGAVMLGVVLGTTSVTCAFAQALASPPLQSGPATRAEVRADLTEWVAAGLQPIGYLCDVCYPEEVLKVGEKVARQRAQAPAASQ